MSPGILAAVDSNDAVRITKIPGFLATRKPLTGSGFWSKLTARSASLGSVARERYESVFREPSYGLEVLSSPDGSSQHQPGRGRFPRRAEFCKSLAR